VLNNLAALYAAQERYGEAERYALRALHIHETLLGLRHPKTATTLSNLANLYRLQGRNAEAVVLLRRAMAIREEALGPQHPDLAVNPEQSRGGAGEPGQL